MASVAFPPDPRIVMIEEHLRRLDFTELGLWDQLDVLSTHTRIEGIEIPTEGIVVGSDDRFSAAVNLYVSLQYGKDVDEGFTSSESFLARIRGHFAGNKLMIDESSVDTTSFYE